MASAVSIPLFKVYMSEQASGAVDRVLQSGQIGQGPEVDAFEEDLLGLFGKKPLTVNACTSALHLAMHMVGVSPGDEVITTAQTCLATNISILHLGATPVFADIDPVTGNIDPDAVKHALSPKTRAIVAVDWAGRACDYNALRSHGVPVIEDAAHAVGTQYDGSHVAVSGGDYVCFSFQAIKHLTTGDGGALVVPGSEYERAKRLRWFGLDRDAPGLRFEQQVVEAGFKFHMNDISAAIGRVNLRELDGVLEKHRANAEKLRSMLDGIPGVLVPPADPGSSWWLLTIIVASPREFMEGMNARGIGCSVVHSRNDVKACFRNAIQRGPLSGLEEFEAHQISVPVGWWLDDNDLERIAGAVEECR